MPAITDQALCIRRWDFSETSQTVSLFTREHGVIRALAKGAKREKGSFSGGLDLLTRGRIAAIVRTSGALATLTEWRLEEVFWAVRTSLTANRVGLYMADLIHHMITEQDPHPALFDATGAALRALSEDAGSSAWRTLLRFQWHLLDETGYRPELERNAEAGAAVATAGTLAFSPRAGGVVTDTGAPDRWRVRVETIALLKCVAAGEDVSTAGSEVVDRGCRLLAAYLREIIGSEPRTMAWVFSDFSV